MLLIVLLILRRYRHSGLLRYPVEILVLNHMWDKFSFVGPCGKQSEFKSRLFFSTRVSINVALVDNVIKTRLIYA